MTRKDYEAIASILSHSSVRGGFDFLCYTLAAYMGADNANFDRKKFLLACSGGDSGGNHDEV